MVKQVKVVDAGWVTVGRRRKRQVTRRNTSGKLARRGDFESVRLGAGLAGEPGGGAGIPARDGGAGHGQAQPETQGTGGLKCLQVLILAITR